MVAPVAAAGGAAAAATSGATVTSALLRALGANAPAGAGATAKSVAKAGGYDFLLKALDFSLKPLTATFDLLFKIDETTRKLWQDIW